MGKQTISEIPPWGSKKPHGSLGKIRYSDFGCKWIFLDRALRGQSRVKGKALVRGVGAEAPATSPRPNKRRFHF